MKILTVVIPSYNVESTLNDTLDSLCADETILDDLDIVVVDDGSADGTSRIARRYAGRHPDSVRLIRKENGGHGSTVNEGIRTARGKYFKVIDGDDRVEQKGFSALVRLLHESQADIVAADYQKVSLADGSREDMRFEAIDYGRCYRFEELPRNARLYLGIHSITIRTQILREHDIRLQEHTFYVDVEYGLLPIPFVRTVEFMRGPVYLYYVGNQGQSIAAANFVRRYDDHYRVVRRMAEFARTCETDSAHRDYMDSVLLKLFFTHYMLSVFYDDDTARGKERARQFDRWLKEESPPLYRKVGGSLYIRLLRATGFRMLPRGRAVKGAVSRVYHVFKPFFRKKKKLTY